MKHERKAGSKDSAFCAYGKGQSMNGILYMDVSVFEDVLLYEKGKTLLSAERRMYMEKLKNPKAARLSLGAGVLLFFALQKCNYTEQLEKIKKHPWESHI